MNEIQKKLLDCWDSLMSLYYTIPNEEKSNYALPYLVYPPDCYFSSQFRVLVLGKETNGWGDKEKSQWEKQNYMVELIQLYRSKVCCALKTDSNSPFWNFFNRLKKGSNANKRNEKVGFAVANVALLGYKYGDKGFDPSLINKGKLGLAYSLELLYNALTPNMILGDKLNNGDVKYYINVLKGANIIPNKCINVICSKDITPKDKKRKIKIFEIESVKSETKIFMTRHPQGCSYGAICDFIIKKIEESLVEVVNKGKNQEICQNRDQEESYPCKVIS